MNKNNKSEHFVILPLAGFVPCWCLSISLDVTHITSVHWTGIQLIPLSTGQWRNHEMLSSCNLLPLHWQCVSKHWPGGNYPALAIFDNSNVQAMEEIMKLLQHDSVHIVNIPANCTDHLQTMDQPQPQPVNLCPSVMKFVGGKWLVKMFECIRSNPSFVVNGLLGRP